MANEPTGGRNTGGNNTPDGRQQEERKAQPRTQPPPGDTGPTNGRNETDLTSSSLRRDSGT